MTNAQSKSIDYFNVHTEGLGYLDSFVLVSPKPRQNFEPFYTADFCLLEGNPTNPEKTYVSLSIPGQNVVEKLESYREEINNNQVKVIAGVRLAKFRAQPYQKGANSQNAGQFGVNYTARLIAVLYLKVGDTVIRLKRDSLKTAEPNLAEGRAQKPDSNAQYAEASVFERPLTVRLSEREPNFEQHKDRLEQEGYKWHDDSESWVLPQVVLTKDDPEFKRKIFELKQAGYRWESKLNVWRKAAGNGPLFDTSCSTHTNKPQALHN